MDNQKANNTLQNMQSWVSHITRCLRTTHGNRRPGVCSRAIGRLVLIILRVLCIRSKNSTHTLYYTHSMVSYLFFSQSVSVIGQGLWGIAPDLRSPSASSANGNVGISNEQLQFEGLFNTHVQILNFIWISLRNFRFLLILLSYFLF